MIQVVPRHKYGVETVINPEHCHEAYSASFMHGPGQDMWPLTCMTDAKLDIVLHKLMISHSMPLSLHT